MNPEDRDDYKEYLDLTTCDGCHNLCSPEHLKTRGEGITEMVLCDDCRDTFDPYKDREKL